MKMFIKKYINTWAHECIWTVHDNVCVHKPKHMKSSWELKNQKKELKLED